MRTIKVKLFIESPFGVAKRVLFTRVKAAKWVNIVGKEHVLGKECTHPQCAKARVFMDRGILSFPIASYPTHCVYKAIGG